MYLHKQAHSQYAIFLTQSRELVERKQYPTKRGMLFYFWFVYDYSICIQLLVQLCFLLIMLKLFSFLDKTWCFKEQ